MPVRARSAPVRAAARARRPPRAAARGPSAAQRLLASVGARVRALREEQGRSRRELAQASSLSERFLADLESGSGNISLSRLAEVCRALGTRLSVLLRDAEEAGDARGKRAGGPLVALLGLRGAGKSTIGRALASRLGVPFVELDERVEAAAGLSLAGIFSLHGEEYYRRLAREVLSRLLGELDAAVIATGGSIVTDREALRLLTRRCRTVWLQATPEDHWRRVLEQGDERPSAASGNAQAELRALLQARSPLYAQAELSIDTSRLGVEGAVDAVARKVAGK